MSVLRIAAIVLAVLALICAVGESSIAGVDALTWFFASWFAFVLEPISSSPVFVLPSRRPPPQ